MADASLRSVTPVIRRATADDLPRVVALIVAGSLDGRVWDDASLPLDRRYYDAFAAMSVDPDFALMVAEIDGEVVGTFQIAVIKNLHHHGESVAQVESVHVAESMRNRGIGEAMMRWAMDEARRRGCFRLQLTSNAARADAHRFYKRLGFEGSHVGFKLTL